jgi:hypothetical protein
MKTMEIVCHLGIIISCLNNLNIAQYIKKLIFTMGPITMPRPIK